MASCKFCLNNNVDTWFGSWCESCHRLQRMIALFSIDKIMSVLDTVLLVDETEQKVKIKEELKSQLHVREYNLKKGNLKTIKEEK